MANGKRTRFLAYYRHVLSAACADASSHVLGAAVTIVCAAAACFIRTHWGLLPINQQWPTSIANALPAIVVCSIFCLLFIVRAPWKIHNQTTAEKDRVQDELSAERGRNSRPEITIRMESATFERGGPVTAGWKGARDKVDTGPIDPDWMNAMKGASPAESEEKGAGQIEETGPLLIVLVVSFLNTRPQAATVDRCEFVLRVGSDLMVGHRRQGLAPMAAWLRAPLHPIPELEPNALLQQGITVTRAIAFQLVERRAAGTEFPDSGVFEFAAFDSFGVEHRIERSASGLCGSSNEIHFG